MAPSRPGKFRRFLGALEKTRFFVPSWPHSRRLPRPEERPILDAISDLVVYQDIRHRIIWANRSAGESVNLPSAALAGKFCYALWHGRSAPCPDCPVALAFRTGETREAEVTSPDGRIWFIKGYPVKDKKGRVGGAVEVIQETTVRRQAEDALRESQERYDALFDRSLYCVFVNDLRGRFIDANNAALDLLGYTREEISSLTFTSLLDAVQLPKAFRILDQIIKTGTQKEPVEYRLRRKDGSHVWVEVEASTILRQGESLAVQGIARDITDHKRAEEELTRSLKEKEVLLREVHHRVKNNLQVISSLLDMKSMRTANPELVELCNDARAKIQTMALIHTHLYQSKLFSKIDMTTYVQDLYKYLSHVYGGKRISITPVFRLSGLDLAVTQAMPFAIVLNEILTNSFKHAFLKRPSGQVEIMIRKSKDDQVFCRIHDDGQGFPEDLDFERVNTLGLKLVRNLVRDQLKGQVRIIRKNGAGVIIEFPIPPEEEPHG
jgi:PAS domain S-box-containing protein